MTNSESEADGEVIWMQGAPFSDMKDISDRKASSGSVIQYPFYMKQPTEKMDRLFNKYKELFMNMLGESVVSINQMGSGAIRGMPGSAMIDIMVTIKNHPPTAEQIEAMNHLNFVFMFGNTGKSPHTHDDTWMRSVDFPPQGDFNEFKVDGKFPPEGHLGMITVHLLHYTNPFVVRSLAYSAYLNANEDAFRRYRDVKIQGARTSPESKDDNTFMKYKRNKGEIVEELMEEALAWKAKNGVLFPEEQVS